MILSLWYLLLSWYLFLSLWYLFLSLWYLFSSLWYLLYIMILLLTLIIIWYLFLHWFLGNAKKCNKNLLWINSNKYVYCIIKQCWILLTVISILPLLIFLQIHNTSYNTDRNSVFYFLTVMQVHTDVRSQLRHRTYLLDFFINFFVFFGIGTLFAGIWLLGYFESEGIAFVVFSIFKVFR